MNLSSGVSGAPIGGVSSFGHGLPARGVHVPYDVPFTRPGDPEKMSYSVRQLTAWMKQGAYRSETRNTIIRSVAYQALDGLAYLAQHGKVLADLSAETLAFSDRDSRLIFTNSERSTLDGSRTPITHKDNVFDLGLVLYDMLNDGDVLAEQINGSGPMGLVELQEDILAMQDSFLRQGMLQARQLMGLTETLLLGDAHQRPTAQEALTHLHSPLNHRDTVVRDAFHVGGDLQPLGRNPYQQTAAPPRRVVVSVQEVRHAPIVSRR